MERFQCGSSTITVSKRNFKLALGFILLSLMSILLVIIRPQYYIVEAIFDSGKRSILTYTSFETNFSHCRPISESPYFERNDKFKALESFGWTYRLISKNSSNINNTIKQLIGCRITVPNIVHYVWLGTDLKFTFIHYLSFLSAHKFLKPEAIFVYGEEGPKGEWWERVRGEVSNVYHVKVQAPKVAPNGHTLVYPAHGSDILRTDVMYEPTDVYTFELGGIYLDADVFVLKSFDPFRIYSTTMGRERSDGICNGIMIAEPRAPFIKLLLRQYHYYNQYGEKWAEKSVEFPHLIAKAHPRLIHVEENSLNIPNFWHLDEIYEKAIDWRGNYAMHLWIRLLKDSGRKEAKDVMDIDCGETTFNQIARHIYYGSMSPRPYCNTLSSLVT